jgi:lipopolysaccharide biosynthesis glycosyltransferase
MGEAIYNLCHKWFNENFFLKNIFRRLYKMFNIEAGNASIEEINKFSFHYISESIKGITLILLVIKTYIRKFCRMIMSDL